MKDVDADQFHVGGEYEIADGLGALFLEKKWAVQVASLEPATPTPDADPSNVIRESNPFYPFDQPPRGEVD